MSKDTYQIEFNDRKIQINQILSALMEIAKEMEINHKKSMSKIKWAARSAVNPPKFNVKEPIFEATAPPELTKDEGVSNEVLRIVPVNDNKIQIAITDASLPPTKCQELAINFAQQIYRKVTGKTLTKKQILLTKIATLEENICEYCLQPIEGLPYTCQNCGRTFCYDHRRPETHGCQCNVKLEPREKNIPRYENTRASKMQFHPKVIIRKILCG